MMTSNRPLEDWGKLVGDVPSATAIPDRFPHHAELIQLTGRTAKAGTGHPKKASHEPEGDSSKIVEPTPATTRKGWLVLRRP
jgi:IstB-like ATP binding protein